MKDGYYLSAYLHIDKLAHLTDLRIRHDQNLSLWYKCGNNIRLIHYWELERITGLKRHNKSLYTVEQAREIINKLLKSYDLNLDDMVEIWGTPQLQTDKEYSSIMEYPDLSYHSIAHLFSGIMFDSSKFYNENIIGLAVDGGPDNVIDTDSGDKYYYSGCVSKKGKLELFPVYSPGFLWTFARKRFKLREGSLMALATASNSEAYLPEEELILINKTEDLKRAYDYVNKLADKLEALTEEDKGILFNGFDSRFSIEDNKISMAAKIIQKMSVRIMEKCIDEIIQKYSIDTKNTYLSISGGFALNCPTNSYLMKKYQFKGFMAPPCVSDTGISLGIALYAFHKRMDNIVFNMQHAYYGNKDNSLQDIIAKESYKAFIKSIQTMEAKQVVNDIKEGAVVWINGASEVGPRALGNRSIIADPRTKAAKDQLNEVKQRQWWRPVAPIVLEEHVEEWFEEAYPTPFMLHTFTIKEDKRELIPAIAHLDMSARVQTLNKADNPELYEVIKAFKEDTGVPIICNTSLNDSEEPIIDKIEEALNFALRKNIKIAYINGKRIELHNHKNYGCKAPLKRPFQIKVYKDDLEKQRLLKELNPFDLPRELLVFYYNKPELKLRFDIKKEKDIRKFAIFAKLAAQKLGLAEIPRV